MWAPALDDKISSASVLVTIDQGDYSENSPIYNAYLLSTNLKLICKTNNTKSTNYITHDVINDKYLAIFRMPWEGDGECTFVNLQTLQSTKYTYWPHGRWVVAGPLWSNPVVTNDGNVILRLQNGSLYITLNTGKTKVLSEPGIIAFYDPDNYVTFDEPRLVRWHYNGEIYNISILELVTSAKFVDARKILLDDTLHLLSSVGKIQTIKWVYEVYRDIYIVGDLIEAEELLIRSQLQNYYKPFYREMHGRSFVYREREGKFELIDLVGTNSCQILGPTRILTLEPDGIYDLTSRSLKYTHEQMRREKLFLPNINVRERIYVPFNKYDYIPLLTPYYPTVIAQLVMSYV